MKCWIWRNIFLVTSMLVSQRSLTGMQHNVVKCQPLYQDSSPSLATNLACDLAWITLSPCFSPYPAMKYLFYPLKYRGKHRFHVLFSVLACQRLMTLFLTAINFFVCGGGKRNTVMHRQNQMYQKNACIFLEKALEDFTWWAKSPTD